MNLSGVLFYVTYIQCDSSFIICGSNHAVSLYFVQKKLYVVSVGKWSTNTAEIDYQPHGQWGKLATAKDSKTDVSNLSPSSEWTLYQSESILPEWINSL